MKKIAVAIMLVLVTAFTFQPAAAEAPARNPCTPEYCIPQEVRTTAGNQSTVYRVRFESRFNGETKQFTSGPYFSLTKALDAEETLREDGNNLYRTRIQVLNPGWKWEPAIR